MDPEHWQQIKGIFQRACELDAAARLEYVDRACRDDGELRREVEALLAHHEQAGRFIEAPVSAEPQVLAGSRLGSLNGRSLGAYRILDRIGHGGMGDIYMAERGDDQYRQRVAIKLIKLGMDSDLLVARFRQERQILANLDHPSIARLLDGGTLEDGRPYLVMEHIDGEPIDRYCRRLGLSIPQRLELFRQVCDAVQYAHRNLVIHRDLKPSNILVTAGGTPKLLDFGTAKLLEGSDEEAPATRTGLRLLTPAYASPEQLKGETITTASDIYALGVVLYELLTGRRPFDFENNLSPEVVRVVCEEKPPRPSTLIARGESRTGAEPATRPDSITDPGSTPTTGKRWRRMLAGDLDNIVLMALRKEPSRRYATVEQLSEDLRRHVADLPVAAQPDTLRYRAGKFVRRHRAAVVAASLVFLVLATAVVVTTWQARRATAASVRAEKARAQTQGVTDFLVRLLEASDPGESQGRDVTVREMLDRGAGLIDELQDQPEQQAALLATMGFVYYRLSAYDRAQELLEEALDIRIALGVRGLELAEVLDDLGQVLMVRGDAERAREMLREGLDLRRSLLEAPHPEIAASLNNLGVFHEGRDDYEASRQLHEKALAMRRALPRAEGADVAESLNNLGAVLQKLGRIGESEKLIREALEIRRGLFENDHPALATSLNNLGSVLFEQGAWEEAEDHFRESVEMGRRLLRGQDHRELATRLGNLASVLSQLGRLDEAEVHYVEVSQMLQRLLGPEHIDVAWSLENLGVLYQNRRDYERAVDCYRRACQLLIAAGVDESISPCLEKLAWTLYFQGDYPAAVVEFGRLLELQRRLPDLDRLALATNLLGQGMALMETGDAGTAMPRVREAAQIRRLELSDDPVRVANAEGTLADCLIALGRYAEAEPLALGVRTSLTQELGVDHASTQRAEQRIADLYEAWGRPRVMPLSDRSQGSG